MTAFLVFFFDGLGGAQSQNAFLLGEIEIEPQLTGTLSALPRLGGTIVFNEQAR